MFHNKKHEFNTRYVNFKFTNRYVEISCNFLQSGSVYRDSYKHIRNIQKYCLYANHQIICLRNFNTMNLKILRKKKKMRKKMKNNDELKSFLKIYFSMATFIVKYFFVHSYRIWNSVILPCEFVYWCLEKFLKVVINAYSSAIFTIKKLYYISDKVQIYTSQFDLLLC